MATVYYDCDGKKLENVYGEFCFWPNPHAGWDILETGPPNEGGMVEVLKAKCTRCGLIESWRELDRLNCLPEYEPCSHCGLRGICASDCGGIMAALSDPSIYLATGDHEESVH